MGTKSDLSDSDLAHKIYFLKSGFGNTGQCLLSPSDTLNGLSGPKRRERLIYTNLQNMNIWYVKNMKGGETRIFWNDRLLERSSFATTSIFLISESSWTFRNCWRKTFCDFN